jgi:hypothetical protein
MDGIDLTSNLEASLIVSQPDPAAEALASSLEPFLVPSIYSIIFLLSLPIFYATSFSTPLFLSLTALSFLFAVHAVPPRVRRVLHPILTCAFLTVMGIWGLGAARGWSLERSLRSYSTGSKYLILFDPTRKTHIPPPGAGDVLSSVLDASIVSLAIPMYRYRGEMVSPIVTHLHLHSALD